MQKDEICRKNRINENIKTIYLFCHAFEFYLFPIKILIKIALHIGLKKGVMSCRSANVKPSDGKRFSVAKNIIHLNITFMNQRTIWKIGSSVKKTISYSNRKMYPTKSSFISKAHCRTHFGASQLAYNYSILLKYDPHSVRNRILPRVIFFRRLLTRFIEPINFTVCTRRRKGVTTVMEG